MTGDAIATSGRLLILLALVFLGLAPLGEVARAGSPISVIASGLSNPRGFTFGPDNALYAALAGQPGTNAGVAKIDAGGCPVLVVDGLPGYRVAFGGVAGVADVAFREGQGYLLLAGGDIDGGGMPNGLYRFDERGEVTLVADVSAFIRDHPVAERPGDYDTDGQPYALLPMGDAFWATEGNSNQVLRLGLDGNVSRIADLSRGHPIPTGIAPAADGGAFVAFLTSAPYRDGAAKVVHVAADGAVTTVWSGLTLVTALAVGPDGSLYALEMATAIDADDPGSIRPGSGKVVRQTGPDDAEDIVTGLALPVALEFGPDGALYVASPAFGGDDRQGSIIRVDLSAGLPVDASVPAPPQQPCP